MRVKTLIVDGLERACWAMRHVERIPVVGLRLYPLCVFAQWSYDLDKRWGTRRWPYHDWDSWERWYEQTMKDPDAFDKGRWHAITN
jgi:hypothetical protein